MTSANTSPVRLKPRGALLFLLASLVAAGSCQTTQPLTATTRPVAATPGLVNPAPLQSVRAVVTPPAGWRQDPLKSSPNHTHQVWVSPTGQTAFGVIHFTMPLPVSANFILPFYLHAWKKDQGEATLLTQSDDPTLPGVRFVAEGGAYKTWSNLIVSGLEGWSVYAGVLRDKPVAQAELDLATAAREHTRVGLPPG